MDKFMWGSIHSMIWFWIPLTAFLLFVAGNSRRQKLLRIILDTSLIPHMLTGVDTGRRKWKAFLLVSALIFAVIALMQPLYDYTWETTKKTGVDILIALDTSKSMYADDLSPSRFERSKLEIKNLINALDGDRIGLLLFTSRALVQCPVTVDYATFKMFLDEAEIGLLPRGGTSLATAIEKACDSFDKKYRKERILIVVSDGETHDPELKKSLEKAREADIKIFSVGLGTSAGVPVAVPNEAGGKEYIKDESGNIVLTRLQEAPLKEMAEATGGAYIHADNASFSLETLYKARIQPLEGRELESQKKKRYENRFYIPLALCLLFLLIEAFLPERKR